MKKTPRLHKASVLVQFVFFYSFYYFLFLVPSFYGHRSHFYYFCKVRLEAFTRHTLTLALNVLSVLLITFRSGLVDQITVILMCTETAVLICGQALPD